MPSASAIILNDGTADRTFTPTSISDKALYECRDSTTSAGFSSLVFSLDRAKPTRPTNKVFVRYAEPIEMTADGEVTIRSTPRANTDFILPDDMSAAERLAFANTYLAALANALIKGYVVNLEPAY